ncbi:MAG: hypothetical protein ABF624_01560 [Liquorilactobacillus ghanensis]|uniref:hypothetical protein n=1 Tax=Liquorilactobacillus TaxID=2767888 RepID=UPI0039EA0D5D
MTQNKLTDLNNHLFAELERLGDEDLKGDSLKEEITRAKAISGVATNVVENANLALKAAMAYDDRQGGMKLPKMISVDEHGK